MDLYIFQDYVGLYLHVHCTSTYRHLIRSQWIIILQDKFKMLTVQACTFVRTGYLDIILRYSALYRMLRVHKVHRLIQKSHLPPSILQAQWQVVSVSACMFTFPHPPTPFDRREIKPNHETIY